jgi:hypothetical protein
MSKPVAQCNRTKVYVDGTYCLYGISNLQELPLKLFGSAVSSKSSFIDQLYSVHMSTKGMENKMELKYETKRTLVTALTMLHITRNKNSR